MTPKTEPGRHKVRVNLYFTPASYAQLLELSEQLNLSRSSVVRQAVSRLFKSEPLVKRKRKNVSDQADV